MCDVEMQKKKEAAVEDLSSSILRGSAEAMTRHAGNGREFDQEVLLAGFAHAVQKISKLLVPTLRGDLIATLSLLKD